MEIPENLNKWNYFKTNPSMTVNEHFFIQLEKSEHKKEQKEPGFIVIHQYVGNLPTEKAEAFCAKVRDHFTQGKDWEDFKEKYPNWNFVLIPSRTEESRIEVFHENETERKNIISEIANRNSTCESPLKDSPELEKQVKNYVTMMLGNVKVSEATLDFCYRHCLNIINDYHLRRFHYTLTYSHLAQNANFLCEGALAHAMIIVSRTLTEESEFLYKEGKEKLEIWKKQLSPNEE